jgi:hypothetical protein
MELPGYDEWKLACPDDGYEQQEPSDEEREPREHHAADAAYALDIKGHVRGCCCHECTDVSF